LWSDSGITAPTSTDPVMLSAVTETKRAAEVGRTRESLMARSTQGQIPDDNFENDHGPPKEKVPLTQAELDWLAQLKKEVEDDAED
jgi:hypothetical protein